VLTAEEKSRRERSRTSTKGFTTYDLSEDGARVLVTLSSKLYVVTRADLNVTELPGVNWIAPKFSPDGAFVAAVRAGELHVIDLATLTVNKLHKRLDRSHHPRRRRLHCAGRDGSLRRFLVVARLPFARPTRRPTTLPSRRATSPTRCIRRRRRKRVPTRTPGSANPKVRVGVIARDGGDTHWIKWDAEKFPYLARVNWNGEGAPLTILVHDRPPAGRATPPRRSRDRRDARSCSRKKTPRGLQPRRSR